MKNNRKFEVCYNVQASVDSKNKLIVDCDVVNDIKTFKYVFKRKMKVVADTGYYNAEEIKNCIDKKVTLYIKKSKANNKTGKNEYRKDKFLYQKDSDTNICPEGNELVFSSLFGNLTQYTMSYM